jgi:hypothetical protein
MRREYCLGQRRLRMAPLHCVLGWVTALLIIFAIAVLLIGVQLDGMVPVTSAQSNASLIGQWSSVLNEN